MPHLNGGFRGTRVGVLAGAASSMRPELAKASPAPRMSVHYWCTQGHETVPVFAQLPEDQIPPWWECAQCGAPGGRNPESGVVAVPVETPKSHLEYVMERRTPEQAAVLLQEALERHRNLPGIVAD
ncbi:MAG: RNA polymerase-binding protein RbpA [Acidobacteria bacterium]|nr:RNA polymerase-binding protein RbpA [Acidobacteriota bacterium]